ncbi:MAG: 3'-5' exonuclease [Victivallales bacterium]|nr:3'-5' exonuclease [Victivallales bacterium]
MKLKLKRPLVFFDLETTGVNLSIDRIVEISVVKLFPNGEREVKTRRVNPEMHIPEGASLVHGIYDADVAEEPTFKSLAKNLLIYLNDCDLCGYNILRFDVPMLINEFQRVGLTFPMEGRKLLDAFKIFCQMEPRSLAAAYKFYCGKEIKDAHSAEADTLATYEVFMGQLDKYDELADDVDSLHEFCNQKDPDWIDGTGKFKWSGSDPVIGFGKNAGMFLRQAAVENPGFLQWMIKMDFPDDAKEIARDALSGKFPKKENISNDQE